MSFGRPCRTGKRRGSGGRGGGGGRAGPACRWSRGREGGREGGLSEWERKDKMITISQHYLKRLSLFPISTHPPLPPSLPPHPASPTSFNISP